MAASIERLAGGTSPRMRGKLTLHRSATRGVRNIPAHAGKTWFVMIVTSAGWEHPRACGENFFKIIDVIKTAGTSPRMRGKLFCTAYGSHLPGNIPAHAGKTPFAPTRAIGFREHPRACGENLFHLEVGVESEGTSPRMRGKLLIGMSRRVPGRNIPAHAGKTLCPMLQALSPEEHPRACGENFPRAFPGRGITGTSPRMRGKLTRDGNWLTIVRNIPAHAGKTSTKG